MKTTLFFLLALTLFSCSKPSDRVKVINESEAPKFNVYETQKLGVRNFMMAKPNPPDPNKPEGILLNDLVGMVLASVLKANSDTVEYLRVKTMKLTVSSTITNTGKVGIDSDYFTFTDETSGENSRVNTYNFLPEKYVLPSDPDAAKKEKEKNAKLLTKETKQRDSITRVISDMSEENRRGDPENPKYDVDDFKKVMAQKQSILDEISRLDFLISAYDNAYHFQESLILATKIGMTNYAELHKSYGKAIAGCYSVEYGFKLTKTKDGKIQFKILGITPSGEVSKSTEQEHSIELDFGSCK